MHRGDFLALTAAVTLAAPLMARAADPAAMAPYDPARLQVMLAEGRTVLDFRADWCSTCAAQQRVLTALRSANPACDTAITFVDVDGDQWGDSQIVRDLGVPRRSTLVLPRGETMLGRVIAATAERDLKALLDRALQR